MGTVTGASNDKHKFMIIRGSVLIAKLLLILKNTNSFLHICVVMCHLQMCSGGGGIQILYFSKIP